MSNNPPRLEEGAAIAVLSFAVIEVFRMYTTTAPPLTEVRKTRRDDWLCAQQLLDADVITGLLVAVMGIGALVLMRRAYPLVFLILTFAALSYYYHAVRKSPSDVREL